MISRIAFSLLLLATLIGVPNQAEATPYCHWTLSRDHRLVTVYGPEGYAWIRVRTASGPRTFKVVIDEGTGVKLFHKPHRASTVGVKARASTDHFRHLCARP